MPRFVSFPKLRIRDYLLLAIMAAIGLFLLFGRLPPAAVDLIDGRIPGYNPPGINSDEFAALRIGMSYVDAAGLIGGPGELVSEMELHDGKRSTYRWPGETGGSAHVGFSNGRLVHKTQIGI